MQFDEQLRRYADVSMIHVDFMIGSAAMEVDGILHDGMTEPIMRAGEWAF